MSHDREGLASEWRALRSAWWVANQAARNARAQCTVMYASCASGAGLAPDHAQLAGAERLEQRADHLSVELDKLIDVICHRILSPPVGQTSDTRATNQSGSKRLDLSMRDVRSSLVGSRGAARIRTGGAVG